MDYPHPIARLVDGKITLDGAYDNKIGVWDKVAIQYGYAEFPATVNEKEELNNLLQDAIRQGLTFLSDQDARPAGSAHPFAHLWDNGADAADELNRVMQIRQVALKNFGEKNIRNGMPMATLEEVLVPIYFFHRYQVEAATKLIGGLNYRYALRGDGQFSTQIVSPAQQQKALEALVKTIAPESLSLPESLIEKIPPRPLGYVRSREVVKVRTDLTFDALSPAESAADMVIGLVLHPARAQRLVEYHARNAQNPSLEAVIDQLVKATIETKTQSGFARSVQFITNDVLLTQLFKLAASKESSSLVKSIVFQKLDQLKRNMADRSKATQDSEWQAHFKYNVFRIDKFLQNPSEYELESALVAPPGQPIGNSACDFEW
jgi:hypothetical protein